MDNLMFEQRFQCELSWNKVKYARITITHVYFIALTLAGSLGWCWTLGLSASCSNSILGTRQMLMHEKTCVIPILNIPKRLTKSCPFPSWFYNGLSRRLSNMSDCRYLSDCRSRGREFHPGPVSYFDWDWSYVLVNYLVKLAQEKSVVRLTDHPDMTIAVDWDVKHQNKQTYFIPLW